jgi:hypothetical protein
LVRLCQETNMHCVSSTPLLVAAVVDVEG